MFLLSALMVLKHCLPLYDRNTYIDLNVLDDVKNYAVWAEYQVTQFILNMNTQVTT